MKTKVLWEIVVVRLWGRPHVFLSRWCDKAAAVSEAAQYVRMYPPGASNRPVRFRVDPVLVSEDDFERRRNLTSPPEFAESFSLSH